ncbi:unnamed protein product [Closterium sp. Naga37s-1]|nr:unnamed protein product [Closterium sp. Naga37s-1]CAI5501884.1 unnamed protein product [Closterium sp. Naga37s-1]CAI5521125.1 unnamed protein product [Closterium sp. Naga37s-1]CAI5521126.1 unnamed protein product [Closterium sp. Naga37s-1]CAI5521127.1 unnamed protein product [Closterium sp. Naga37s-1]
MGKYGRATSSRKKAQRGIVVQQSSIGQTISVTGYSGDSNIPPLVSDAPLERKLQQQRVPKQKPVPQKPVTLPQQKPVPTRRPVPAVVKPAAQVQQPAAVQQPAVVQQPAEGQQQGTEGQQSATEKSEAQKIADDQAALEAWIQADKKALDEQYAQDRYNQYQQDMEAELERQDRLHGRIP